MNSTPPRSGEINDADQSLRARLRITPDPDLNCGILESGTEGTVVARNEVCIDPSCADGCECRAELEIVDDEIEVRDFVASSVDEEACVCPVFRERDCTANIESYKNDFLYVSITVPSRDVLSDIVATLRERGASVSLERIQSLSSEESEGRTVELDVSTITKKQREAIEMAVEAGYYDYSTEKAELEELAAELDISLSAFTQRLRAAESKLVRELSIADGFEFRNEPGSTDTQKSSTRVD
ncbi:HTH-10 family transcriptional regulator [Halalkaliarchaeum desulfuricum]|uniref:HTH-10 family transcriptional regulator n=1 Tax=Halalkaliarchaeum desulfuricum TaxID=2055893 RepID=A0A343TMH6_9EURY|nr:helix-turn-helix domain-containing protein [Halalkaliarchaeum desulfuricum]AUX10298.1 HTH-10 family transcriptional regulator [Halalkaliarchaeum desulfuricum]